MFYDKFCKISKNTLSYITPLVTASGPTLHFHFHFQGFWGSKSLHAWQLSKNPVWKIYFFPSPLLFHHTMSTNNYQGAKVSWGIRVRVPQKLDVVVFWSWNISAFSVLESPFQMLWLFVLWKNTLRSQCCGLFASISRCDGVLVPESQCFFLSMWLYWEWRDQHTLHFTGFVFSTGSLVFLI